MGDRVTFTDESHWESQEGTIVGFITVGTTPCAIIRTKSGRYITLDLSEIRYVS